MVDYGTYGESLAVDIAFWRMGLLDPTYPVGPLGELSMELATKLRSLAIMALLAKGHTDLFYHNLIRSGRTRLIYLERLEKEGLQEEHHRSSGRYEPLVDALAAGDFALVNQIIQLSPADWQTGHEYEDDFCYAQILHKMVVDSPLDSDITPLLAQFETYLGENPWGRFDVVKSLSENDQDAFDQAFEDLLTEREGEIAEDIDKGNNDDALVLAQREIFVEGLALLRLAEKRGLTTESDYLYCPSLARIPMQQPFPGE
jgi:hypothetical protein